jgi:hypothetical protein
MERVRDPRIECGRLATVRLRDHTEMTGAPLPFPADRDLQRVVRRPVIDDEHLVLGVLQLHQARQGTLHHPALVVRRDQDRDRWQLLDLSHPEHVSLGMTQVREPEKGEVAKEEEEEEDHQRDDDHADHHPLDVGPREKRPDHEPDRDPDRGEDDPERTPDRVAPLAHRPISSPARPNQPRALNPMFTPNDRYPVKRP